MRFSLALLLATSVAVSTARGDGRLTYLVRQLEKASDPRLRAQSALLMAATQDPAAVQPLCKALEDPSDIVRSSSARALEQLGESSAQGCLKAHEHDASPDVQTAVKRAIAALTVKKPELYISLLPVQVKSAKVGADMVKLAEDRLRAKLSSIGSLFAPADEPKNAARSVIKGKGLKGYALKVELEDTPTGGLRMRVLCWTYPDQALQGQVEVKASGGGTADLIRALAPKAIQDAAETFDWSS